MKLLLLPGFGGAKEDWQTFSAALPSANTEALDYPSETELSSWLAERLLQEDEPYALLGYSMGGRLALLALEKILDDETLHGYLPNALVLLASGLGISSPMERQNRLVADQNLAAQLLRAPDTFWDKWYAQALFQSLHSMDSERFQAWKDRRKHLDSRQQAAILSGMSPGKQPSLEPILQKLLHQGISVLYIAGDLDKKYSELAQEIKKRHSAVRVEIVPGAGHVLPLEAPELCAELVNEFLHAQGAYHGKKY